MHNRSGFASLIGLILTLAIILILAYVAFKVYFEMPVRDEEIKGALSEQGIDTSSYQSITESTREKVKDVNKQLLQRQKQLEDLR